MQLHATLDISSPMPSQPLSRQAEKPVSNVFYLNRDMFSNVLTAVLADMPDTDEAKIRRVQDIREEGWDMFMQVLPDGSLSIRALAVGTSPIISRPEPHLSLEYRSATPNPPETIHSSKHLCPSSLCTFLPACCSWSYKAHPRIGHDSSVVCSCT
jgi:hypothetical protein